MRMGDGVKGLCLVLRWEKLQHVGGSPQKIILKREKEKIHEREERIAGALWM